MAPENHVAWLDANGQDLRIGTGSMPAPGEDEIVICNRAIAVNPVECKSYAKAGYQALKGHRAAD